jgi:hypothetical protein
METKFDKIRHEMTERAKRVQNIELLTKQFKEAKALFMVIPPKNKGGNEETEQERTIVSKRIKELAELINEETKAYNATFENDL